MLKKLLATAVESIGEGFTIAAVIAGIYLIIRYWDTAEILFYVGGCAIVLVLIVGFVIAHVLGLPSTEGYRGSDGTQYGK